MKKTTLVILFLFALLNVMCFAVSNEEKYSETTLQDDKVQKPIRFAWAQVIWDFLKQIFDVIWAFIFSRFKYQHVEWIPDQLQKEEGVNIFASKFWKALDVENLNPRKGLILFDSDDESREVCIVFGSSDDRCRISFEKLDYSSFTTTIFQEYVDEGYKSKSNILATIPDHLFHAINKKKKEKYLLNHHCVYINGKNSGVEVKEQKIELKGTYALFFSKYPLPKLKQSILEGRDYFKLIEKQSHFFSKQCRWEIRNIFVLIGVQQFSTNPAKTNIKYSKPLAQPKEK